MDKGLKFSDVFKSLNIAYGIDEYEDDKYESPKYESDTDVDFAFYKTKESPPVEVESYFVFSGTLLKEPINSKGFEESFFTEDEEDCDDDVVVAKRSPSPRRLDENDCVDGNADENDQQVPSDEVNDRKQKKMLKQADRQNIDKSNHLLLSPCDCKNKCIMKVDEEQRRIIHGRFWELKYNERVLFLSSSVQVQHVKRRKRDSKGERQRKQSYMYSFVVSDETRQVCQMFFLRTLGFKSNKILLTAMKKSKDGLLPSPDQRGKTVPTNKFSEEKRRDINNHIMSYDPRISHYRRAHAPNRLYLPSELTVTAMHKIL